VTIAYWCVLVSLLFPYVFTVIAKTGPGFDNRIPRLYLEQIEGWRKRAHWIQLNSFEIFPAFAAAVIIAHLVQKPQSLVNILAILFVVFRILYALCYLANRATLRTIFWGLGLLCVLGLFFV
jgi:uncharacterized MAPEG superfamily protein